MTINNQNKGFKVGKMNALSGNTTSLGARGGGAVESYSSANVLGRRSRRREHAPSFHAVQAPESTCCGRLLRRARLCGRHAAKAT